jgi:hypothetical protein
MFPLINDNEHVVRDAVLGKIGNVLGTQPLFLTICYSVVIGGNLDITLSLVTYMITI